MATMGESNQMAERMHRDVWVVCDRRSEILFNGCLKLLGKADQLAAGTGGRAVAVLFDTPEHRGEQADACGQALSTQAVARDCTRHGADQVFILEHPRFEIPRADLQAPALTALINRQSPGLVLLPMTDWGRELAARTSGECACGLMADCVDIQYRDNRFVGSCPAWSGRILAEITYAPHQRFGLATAQAHGFAPSQTPGDPGQIESLAVSLPDDLPLAQLLSRAATPASEKDLTNADIVVVGGAGVGNIAGFARVRELATVLGGQLGATRPPVMNHWVDEDRLIGQTGKTVRPRLLVSVGTSGAIQYTSGIMEAGAIVAINRDPDAQIFQIADIGVVADAITFLPLLIDRVQKATMRALADQRCAPAETGETASRFGDRIRQFRMARQWSVEELAERTGQTPEYIEGVESGRSSPPVSFLVRLAGALSIDPGTFLKKTEQAELRDMRAKAYSQRTRHYSYQTLTDGGPNDHLRAFMVSIEPRSDHKPVAYKHEGEEFIFVWEGELKLKLGHKTHILKPGESIHFNSDIPHKLTSLSNSPTRCLVVLYTV